MPLDKDKLKAQLLQKYSAQLDKMLADLDKPDRLHLTEIEDAALDIRKQVSQDVTASLSQHESESVEVDAHCPECQQVGVTKARRRSGSRPAAGRFRLTARTGTVSIVGQVFSPLDNKWQVDARGYSSQFAYQVVWLSGHVPFAVVSQIFAQLTQLSIGATTIWEQTQVHGEQLVAHQETQESQTSVERTRWNQQDYDPFLKRCLSIDGGMIHIREEGWKECKVGLVSDFVHQWQQDKPGVRLLNSHYTAVIGDVETFSPALWKLAVEQKVPYAGCLVAVCDGAQWIWRLVNDLFPVCTQILDWYHARQKLAQLTQDCFPDDPQQAQRIFQQMPNKLFQGRISDIIQFGQDRQQSTSYFYNQQRRMQYQQFQAQGFPIGSGGVESGIKQYKQRLTGARMRWSRQGAERLVTIRSAILSDTFAELWEQTA